MANIMDKLNQFFPAAGERNPFQATPPPKQKAIKAKWVENELIDDSGNVVMRKPSLLDAAMGVNQFLPVTGDIQSGLLAGRDLGRGDYKSAALNSLGLLPFIPSMGGVINKISKTKYELAHELAQKNATDMLGLPATNTAMERAKAMGFETSRKKEIYHSTNNTNGKDWKTTNIDPALSDLGFHVGSLEQAENRLRAFGTNGVSMDAQGGALLPIMKSKYADFLPIKDEGSFHADSIAPQLEKKGLLSKGHTKKILKDEIGDKNPELWDKKYDQQMRDVLAQNNYDGVRYNNASEGDGLSYAITNPSMIRSRFAAFDPAKANSSDLLGSIDPKILPYLIGTGLLGAGGVNYYNKDK